jgi:transcriptional regulator with PAS, ATPase and Fis domain
MYLLDLNEAGDLSVTAEKIPRSFSNATNKPDLFYRLNVVPLTLSAFRERKEAIVIPARYCVDAKVNSGSEQECRMGAIPHRQFCEPEWRNSM